MEFIGLDLAWSKGSDKRAANESGIVLLNSMGKVVHAGWTRGIEETVVWLETHVLDEAILFIDAPLVVNNDSGQRLCEKQVSQRYWRYRVAANSTNRRSKRLAGVDLRNRLEELGWLYLDGCEGHREGGRQMSECYPYTTIVGARELCYDEERPQYKRRPKGMIMAEFRPHRARECDELIRRVAALSSACPSMDLSSHPETRALVEQPSPISDTEYKHREDLLDAALCAWTASLWARWEQERCQVLGCEEPARDGRRATIVAPAKNEQRGHNRT